MYTNVATQPATKGCTSMLNVVQTNGYADSTATTESPNRTDFFSLHGSHVKAKQGAPSLGREMTGHPEHELTCTLMFVTLKLMNCISKIFF